MSLAPAARRNRTARELLRRTGLPAVAVSALAVLAGACGSAPSDSTAGSTTASSASTGATAPTSTTSAAAYKACMVLDVGGVDDRSFNQSAWAGMQAAKAANPALDVSYVSSASQNDYTPNLTNETNQGCQSVIAVGGLMTDALTAVAKSNPDEEYGIIDSSIDAPNVYSMQFNTAQGGFLGGYLAAGMTRTGKVGTFGGLKIPPVTVYMDGFYDGVQYYNQQKGKNVQVLGWDTKTQNGTFSNSFTDAGAGSTATRTLQQQGADIVFPVAGGSGLGAGAVAQSSGGKLNLIWVDTDGCESAAQYCKYFISTVFKDISSAVQTYLATTAGGASASASADATSGTTSGYVGTLANKGTGLSPFHDFDSQVPDGLKSELTQLSTDIASGKVPVSSPSQPQG